MERSWLIRTTQNQILGPVAKLKLLEFIQKGALGMLDEVSSGNGYWFSLKEKSLVDKYLFGDVPQGYNPISEAQSVVSRQENPDKTSSINASPANLHQSAESATVTPTADNLDFPDITIIGHRPGKTSAAKSVSEEDISKLPDANDLEFPDVSKISSAVKKSFQEFVDLNPSTDEEIKLDLRPESPKISPLIPADDTPAILPNDDDLAFPDMDDFKVDYQTSPKIEKGKVDLSHQHTRTVALDYDQKEDVLPTAKEASNFFAKEVAREDAELPPIKLRTSSHPLKKNNEEKKLLHDRKKIATNTKSGAALRDPSRERIYKDAPIIEPLKKRNDNYIFFILVILILIIVAVFFYFKEILNKPLPV